MERVVSATEARVHFGEMMRKVVQEQEPIVVERDGKPQIVLISVKQYEQFKALSPAKRSWEEMLAEVHQLVARELEGKTLPPADEIIREMREERDAHLLGLLP